LLLRRRWGSWNNRERLKEILLEQVFLNGERIDQGIPLRALFFGEGLFETFRYRHRMPLHFDKHYSRMERGAGLLGIPFAGRENLAGLINIAVSGSGIQDAYVKVCLLSRGELNYSDYASKGDIAVVVRDYESRWGAVKARINDFRRSSDSPLRGLKSLNYLENILAGRAARLDGYDEAVFLNERGEVAEGSASNIFWVEGDTLYTPSVDCGILPGTTRELLLNSMNQLGLSVEEGRYSPECVRGSRFAFLTNALMGIACLTCFDDSEFLPNDELYESIKMVLFAKLGWV
jgi:4-amino-4-deoxychorismate lyase